MNQITVISYNLWDDPLLKNERTKWIVKNIIKDRPDVLLFQEVSNANVLQLTEKLRKYNYNFCATNQGRTSFELIATKWPINDHDHRRYSTSRHGFGLLWAEIELENYTVTVATSKLDPETNKTARRIGQLDCALNFLDTREGLVVFGCDTNLRHDESYYDYPEGWEDAWLASGRNKFAMYTIDSVRNKFVSGNQQSRPDRIYYRGKVQDITFELVGTQAECNDKCPSLHFGIRATLFI